MPSALVSSPSENCIKYLCTSTHFTKLNWPLSIGRHLSEPPSRRSRRAGPRNPGVALLRKGIRKGNASPLVNCRRSGLAKPKPRTCRALFCFQELASLWKLCCMPKGGVCISGIWQENARNISDDVSKGLRLRPSTCVSRVCLFHGPSVSSPYTQSPSFQPQLCSEHHVAALRGHNRSHHRHAHFRPQPNPT